jgi:hypothetical protein
MKQYALLLLLLLLLSPNIWPVENQISRSPFVPVFHRQLIASFPPKFPTLLQHTHTNPALLKNRNGHGR